jgi:adenosylmethionine-8-amino-7-oxononanoate aminotransferase
MKLSCQYFHELGEERNLYISRRLSYHGATMGALSLSGHTARREPFELILSKQVRQVSACNVYRDQGDMSDTAYIKMKEDEMEAMFQEAGPKKVIAVVLEPVVGAVSQIPLALIISFSACLIAIRGR